MKRLFGLMAVMSLLLVPMTSRGVVVELVQNGDLEAWTSGMPDNWDMTNRDAAGNVNASPSYSIIQDTTDLHTGTPGTSALECSRSSTDYTYRYFAFTNQIAPVVGNASYDGWQKGPNCRAYRAYSTDSGVTWTVDNVAALGGVTAPTSWTHVTATISQMQTGGELYKIAFHSFSGDSFVDDVSVIGDDGTAPPLGVGSITPDPKIYLTRTVTLVVTPTGGSGSYTQVAFDINNDSSVEATDTTPPYEYVWNTQNDEAGKGVISVKVTVTDSTSATGSSVFDYTVDNRGAGRVELMTNGGFDQWQAVSGSNQLPVGWVENQPSANATYGQSTDNPDAMSTPSLQVTFATFDNANRYTLRYNGVPNIGGIYQDHQVTFWGKGANCSLEYWKSDDGITWQDSGLVAANAGTPDWLYAIGEVAPLVADTAGGYTTITTANLQDAALFDDISWKAILITPQAPAAARGWRLYK